MTDPRPVARDLPDRRTFLALGVGAFAVAVLPRALRPDRRLVRRQVPAMGTIADIAVVSRDPGQAHRALDAAVGELATVERAMTRFSPHSDVGRANDRAAREAVPIGESTAHVVREALSWAEVSGGSFDPALARAIVLWDVEHRRAPPPMEELRPYTGGGLYRQIELGTWRGRSIVRFHSPEVGIDLGGIAKGYGVDRAVEALKGWGIGSAVVNVGGDLHAMGTSEDGDLWKIGIRSTSDPDRIAGTIRVKDRAVATSGDYAQYFDYRGRRYHHLLDPRTAEPRATDTHSITVTAGTCMAADAAATALFGCDPRTARNRLMDMVPDAEVIHL